MINELWEGEKPGSFRLPDSPWLVGVFVLALQSQASPFLTTLADSSFRVAYLILRTRDMPADDYLAVIDRIVSYGEANAPPGVRLSAAEGIHSILEADRRIIRGQVNSAGLTVVAVGLAMGLLWRSARLALICVLANALPVGLMLATAGFASLPLNSVTVMVAAISLGIAVDNSIHLITLWRELQHDGLDAREAMVQALSIKGRPIVWASAILIAVFALFWLSSFPPVVHFGLLAAMAFVGALGVVLILLPAVLGSGASRAPTDLARDRNPGDESASST
jgi:predicted RND superfamily exporter protein